MTDHLPTRVFSALAGALLLLLVLWGGIPLILPTLLFVHWLGTRELAEMLATASVNTTGGSAIVAGGAATNIWSFRAGLSPSTLAMAQ